MVEQHDSQVAEHTRCTRNGSFEEWRRERRTRYLIAGGVLAVTATTWQASLAASQGHSSVQRHTDRSLTQQQSNAHISSSPPEGQLITRQPSQYSSPREHLCRYADGTIAEADCEAVAAEAADKQASYAFTTLFAGTILGALTLISAGAAAVFAGFAAQSARQAVREARRSADAGENTLAVTRSATHAELRPWIAFRPHLVMFSVSPDRIRVEVRADFENVGKTAAIDVNGRTEIHVMPHVAGERFQKLFRRARETRANVSFTLLPGETSWYGSYSTNVLGDGDTTEEGRFQCVLICLVTYSGQLDPSKQYTTEESFIVSPKSSGLVTRGLLDRSMTGLSYKDVELSRFASGNVL